MLPGAQARGKQSHVPIRRLDRFFGVYHRNGKILEYLGWRFPDDGAEIDVTATEFGLLTNHELFYFYFLFSIPEKQMLRPALSEAKHLLFSSDMGRRGATNHNHCNRSQSAGRQENKC